MTDKSITYEEVLKHNLPEDCWIVINNAVYDVTNYVNQHPGGPIVLQTKAGSIATNAFNDAAHSSQAINNVLPKFKIGTIDPSSQPAPQQQQRQSKGGNILGMVALLVVLLVVGYFVAKR